MQDNILAVLCKPLQEEFKVNSYILLYMKNFFTYFFHKSPPLSPLDFATVVIYFM